MGCIGIAENRERGLVMRQLGSKYVVSEVRHELDLPPIHPSPTLSSANRLSPSRVVVSLQEMGGRVVLLAELVMSVRLKDFGV